MKATEFAGSIVALLSTKVALNTAKFMAKFLGRLADTCTGQQVRCTCSTWRCFSLL